MVVFLAILCGLFFFLSMGTFAFAKSAVHEIEALLYLLIGVLCLCAVSILIRLRQINLALMKVRLDDTEDDTEENTEDYMEDETEDEHHTTLRSRPFQRD